MPRKLTQKQSAYAQARARGVTQEASAIMAGYSENDGDSQSSQTEGSSTVQQELARIRKEAATNTGITKEEVVQMFVEAAGMARIIGDPQGLVAAGREIGRMLGYYAPEIKKTLIGVDKATLKQALDQMDDGELMRIAYTKAFDGEFKRIKDVPAVPPDQGTEVVLQET